jgi:hypothetical protein
MSYESARALEIQDAYARRVEDFVREYRPGKPSIILLPGGMGSQLDRSDEPYEDDGSLPFDAYDPVWMDRGIVTGDAVHLEIMADGRDQGSHVIVSDGPLRFLVKPYEGTETYFRERGENFVIFGFDWRRPLAESASHLHWFLQRIRERVMARGLPDPLPTTTLLAHSMGGLVAKVFLHRVYKATATAADIPKWMAQLVTVATPFYGTSNHMQRYYNGEDLLNLIYTAGVIAGLSGTMPGPYILMFMDKATYLRDGELLGLSRYPLRDAEDEGVEVDPYDEVSRPRFPDWVRRESIAQAKKVRQTVTRLLPDPVLEHVFHLRSGLDTETHTELFWEDVDGAGFDPGEDPSPISGENGPGDGTVPFWSARLAQTPESQIYNLRHAGVHMELMEHLETLKVVSAIIQRGALPTRVQVPAEPSLIGPMASRTAVRKFLADVAAGETDLDDPRATDPKIWRRFVMETSLC